MTDWIGHTLLLARSAKPSPGGMETHVQAFLDAGGLCISQDNGLSIYLGHSEEQNGIDRDIAQVILELKAVYPIKTIFLCDLAFIESCRKIRKAFPNVKIISRSGGNDILRAPVKDDSCPLVERQKFVRDIINDCIDIMIVNSDYSYQRSIEMGIRAHLIKKVRGGVNIIGNIVAERTHNRQRFNALHNSNGLILLAFVCRMKPFKGIIEFLTIFLRYVNRDKFFLVFIGEGETLGLAKQMLVDYKFDNYHFFGARPHEEAMRLLSSADYLVNPSIEERRYFGDNSYIHTETMGRSMMEAISMGIPIIASSAGGTMEIFYETSNPGYLFRRFEDLFGIFDNIVANGVNGQIKCPDYSWNNVFSKYGALVSDKKKKIVVAVDIDGTLLADGDTDLSAIRSAFLPYRELIYLIINTARPLDDNLIELFNDVNADWLIASNGLDIYSANKRIIWNDNEFLRCRTIDHASSIYQSLSQLLSNDIEVKRTHPHIIQIRNTQGISPSLRQSVECAIKGTDYYYVDDGITMKLLSKFISKVAALDYLLKDLSYSHVLTAGDSLNDLVFVIPSDFGWISTKLAHKVRNMSHIRTFKDNMIGQPLLSEITKTIDILIETSKL